MSETALKARLAEMKKLALHANDAAAVANQKVRELQAENAYLKAVLSAIAGNASAALAKYPFST